MAEKGAKMTKNVEKTYFSDPISEILLSFDRVINADTTAKVSLRFLHN